MTNISKLNLNLLRPLVALLREQNVSKAANLLGLTQSATSLSLKQLRELFQDELLIRSQGSRMTLTVFAKTLLQPAQEALYQAEKVFLAHIPFYPETSTKTFHIGMSDYIAYRVLPKLMQHLASVAPFIKIVQHAVNYLDSTQVFDDYVIDMAIGDFTKAPLSLKMTSLFSDRGIIAADKNHPAMRLSKLPLKEFLKYPQVFVALEGQPEKNFIFDMLQEQGHHPEVRLMTPHTLIALQSLPGTLLMTNTVEGLAKPFLESLGLVVRDTPYKLKKYHANLYWHSKDQNDPAHQWLREVIKAICKNL